MDKFAAQSHQRPLYQRQTSDPQHHYQHQQSVERRRTVRGAQRGTIRDPSSQEAGSSAALRRADTRPGTRRQNTAGTIRDAGNGGIGGTGAPGRALTRGKTLTRPERFVAPAPLINPHSGDTPYSAAEGAIPTGWDWWGFCVTVLTFWAPGVLLTACGLPENKHRAWKEKCALCEIALFMMGVVGFLTIGLTKVLCPKTASNVSGNFIRLGATGGLIGIEGWNFNVSSTTPSYLRTLADTLGGSDASDYFTRNTTGSFPSCTNTTAAYVKTNLCTNSTSTTCALGSPTSTLLSSLGLTNTTYKVGYSWKQVGNISDVLVINGNVLNLTPYIYANPTAIPTDPVDTAIRLVLYNLTASGGKDATRLFTNDDSLKTAIPCLVEKYYAGHIDKITPGCFISNLFLYVSLALISSIILVRFSMAVIFAWILSPRLVAPPRNLRRKVVSPGILPEGANVDITNTTGAAPWVTDQLRRRATEAARLKKRATAAGRKEELDAGKKFAEPLNGEGMITMASIGAELFCVCLVTCYSEGEDGIRTTLDSIAGSTYSDARKLIFVVCDGMITGSGEKMSTPDIVVGLIERDERFGEPDAMSYVAIADGRKAHNQAMVYAGHYTNVAGHRTPIVVVVKCGPPEERHNSKPGNRGKRDSQMILMNFFSRVTYNDRMTPLDYDLFRKSQALVGVTPDFFEVCLMVDADTMIYPESMTYLVRAMQHDSLIMGVCGETRIGNKRQSWVTMIQVFEYFISHHQAKAFEAVFGGVTCLPGCFSMYRIKARKPDEDDWFPVLVQPQICSQYSQSVVTTLHQKNLLLLGEDRFLTTLLLRTFPNRKMSFCPQARCRTVAPDTFKVLLSQRRRWINSTVHNLMELVLVRNLCGTFCFSMQFVVFIDLVGTIVLPIAICLTLTTAISYIFTPPTSFSDAIPLLLLGLVLGLPAVLILLTTMKLIYVGWMFIYLLALPIWNFVLPVYAFTKFDDFSWGETRKVAGEVKGQDSHAVAEGVAESVPQRRWEDWERSRLRKVKRDDKRRKELERSFGNRFHGDELGVGGNASPRDTLNSTSYEDSAAQSDTTSLFTGEEGWNRQVGAYREDVDGLHPPPVGLYVVEEGEEDTINVGDLHTALDQGWEDSPRNSFSGDASGRYDNLPSIQTPSPALPHGKMFSLSDRPLMGQQPWDSSTTLHDSTTSLGSYAYGDLSLSHQLTSPSHPLVADTSFSSSFGSLGASSSSGADPARLVRSPSPMSDSHGTAGTPPLSAQQSPNRPYL
ncbi:hypothetical protein T439DRAFT_315958 [Meredithblackwellia eburnea MCA 4105]